MHYVERCDRDQASFCQRGSMKGERGRPPIGLERVLRIYFLQQWYGLTDEALGDALYDSQALRGFAGIDLNRGPVPDATTVLVLHFRHWLERHELPKCCSTRSGRCWRSAAC
jgi:Transposase domain (DUF772)